MKKEKDMELYEKLAFLLPALRVAGSLGMSAVRGQFGIGAAKGAGRLAQGVNIGSQVQSFVSPIASSLGVGQKAPPGVSTPFGQVGGPKVGALSLRMAGVVKVAFEFTPKTVANAAALAAMAGAAVIPHDNPWHAGLEGAGLATLGLTTGHDMLTNPAERVPGAMDAAGLALFALALKNRMGHGHVGGADVGDAAKLGGYGVRTKEAAPWGVLRTGLTHGAVSAIPGAVIGAGVQAIRGGPEGESGMDTAKRIGKGALVGGAITGTIGGGLSGRVQSYYKANVPNGPSTWVKSLREDMAHTKAPLPPRSMKPTLQMTHEEFMSQVPPEFHPYVKNMRPEQYGEALDHLHETYGSQAP